MEQSPRLSFSYVMPQQSQKHVTVNETFRRLDALVQLTVLSRTTSAEPASPAEGDAYILPSSPTGTDWGNYTASNIAAYQDGAWIEIAVVEGLRAWVGDDDELVVYDGGAWANITGGETADKFGVNAAADTTNRLTVKSNAVLFDAIDVSESGDGDCQLKVNKEAAGDTASHLFQTGFSGRAEFGLTGDDDFHIKVSANGSSWTEAVVIDKDNGYLAVGGHSNPSKELTVKGWIVLDDEAGDKMNFRNDGSFDLYRASGSSHYIRSRTNSNTLHFGGADSGGTLVYPLVVDGDSNEVRPTSDGASDLGTSSLKWNAVYTESAVAGSPSGGNKGSGTINAEAVYDDNTLLSCYVFDQALDGTSDAAKWDAKVSDRIIPARLSCVVDPETGEAREVSLSEEERSERRHTPFRKFAERIGTDYDPMTLDGYARHWKEKRHLTSLPNEKKFDIEKGMPAGAWIQRLVETVEIQAVLIEELHLRLKALEAVRRA